MGLFKPARRGPAPDPRSHQASAAMDLLLALAGRWQGARREWDPDRRATGAQGAEFYTAHHNVVLTIERDLATAHARLKLEFPGSTARQGAFDVWGADAVTGSVIRTHFAKGARQSNAFDVREIVVGDRSRDWRLVLETVSWDTGRPCEIRHTLSRLGNELDITIGRRLIARGMDFQPLSRIAVRRDR